MCMYIEILIDMASVSYMLRFSDSLSKSRIARVPNMDTKTSTHA